MSVDKPPPAATRPRQPADDSQPDKTAAAAETIHAMGFILGVPGARCCGSLAIAGSVVAGARVRAARSRPTPTEGAPLRTTRLARARGSWPGRRLTSRSMRRVASAHRVGWRQPSAALHRLLAVGRALRPVARRARHPRIGLCTGFSIPGGIPWLPLGDDTNLPAKPPSLRGFQFCLQGATLPSNGIGPTICFRNGLRCPVGSF
ncbi:MAG: hypothetical protein ACK5S5_08960 [Planctomycetota bacterium]